MQNDTLEWNEFKVNGLEILAFQAINNNTCRKTEPLVEGADPDFSVAPDSIECV